MDVEVDENELEIFCKKYQVPIDGRGRYYLPYGYLSSLGVDAFTYEYVWRRIRRGMESSVRDESEIGFIGQGIPKLNNFVDSIYIDETEYDTKEEALASIEED
jgi:hypothetical protein